MSLKAGGVGLNLTAASNVFLMVIDLCIVNPMTCKYLFLHQLANLNGHINFFFLHSYRIHGGILQWKNKLSCEFTVSGKRERSK